jgi:hypothetical protein
MHKTNILSKIQTFRRQPIFYLKFHIMNEIFGVFNFDDL